VTPPSYGPHKTLYNPFVRWSRMGVLHRIFVGLAAEGGSHDQLMAVSEEPSRLAIEAKAAVNIVAYSGVPIDESVVAGGPFVAGTQAELQKSFEDFERQPPVRTAGGSIRRIGACAERARRRVGRR
jgi:hypothetical protein